MTMTDHAERHAHETEKHGDIWKDTIAEVEAGLVRGALKRFGHNQSKAAAALGITRFTLRARMKQFGIVA